MKKLLIALLALGSITGYAQVSPSSLEGYFNLIPELSSPLCVSAISISFNKELNQLGYTHYIPEDVAFLTRVFELERLSLGSRTLKEARFINGSVVEKIYLKDKKGNFNEVSKTEIKIIENHGEKLIQKEEYTKGTITDQCNYH